MRQKWFLVFGLLMAGLLLLIACQEKKEIVGVELPFAIQEIHFPTVVSSLSPNPVLFTAYVTHPQGSAGIDSVYFSLTDTLGVAIKTVRMYDDGGVEHPESGDAIAFDQVYSRLIIPAQWGVPDGNYHVILHAVPFSGQPLESSEQTVEVFPNQPPQILNVIFPDSIPPGMPPVQVAITVGDNDGLNDVLWVVIQGLKPTGSTVVFTDTIYNPQSNNPLFTMEIDSSYAAGKDGDYTLKIFAEDRVGDKSAISAHSLRVNNTSPLVWDAVVPDTLVLPSSGAVSTEITVRAIDRQSAADIDQVYFDAYLPDGTPATNNPFTMFDNGLPYDPNDPSAVGDEIAGDGVYTLTIFLPAGTATGDYAFHFFALDKVGHLTTGPVDTIRVVQ